MGLTVPYKFLTLLNPASSDGSQWLNANFTVIADQVGNATTAITQPMGDNSTKIATTAFVMDAGFESTANKNVANGYAGLDPSGNLVGIVVSRTGTAASLATYIPLAGEQVYATDSKKYVIGDGTTTFTSLNDTAHQHNFTSQTSLPLFASDIDISSSPITDANSFPYVPIFTVGTDPNSNLNGDGLTFVIYMGTNGGFDVTYFTVVDINNDSSVAIYSSNIYCVSIGPPPSNNLEGLPTTNPVFISGVGGLATGGNTKCGKYLQVVTQYATPLTGTTVTFSQSYLIIEPAGSLAALTISLPSSPLEGQICAFTCTQSVITLTVNGGTIVGATVISSSANFGAEYIFRATNSKWYRTR